MTALLFIQEQTLVILGRLRAKPLRKSQEVSIGILNQKVPLSVENLILAVPIILKGLTKLEAIRHEASRKGIGIGTIDREVEAPSPWIIQGLNDPQRRNAFPRTILLNH